MYQTSIRNKKQKKQFQNSNNNNYDINLDYEEYAYVLKLLGNCRVTLITNSGDECIGIIRGTLRKFSRRILIEKGDIVIVSKRDYQNNKVDIVHKYNREQIAFLINEKKLSNTLLNNYNNKNISIDEKNLEDNNNIRFDYEEDVDNDNYNIEYYNTDEDRDNDIDKDDTLFTNTNRYIDNI